MKSIYDFMSKICPWAVVKLTYMQSQQNWSGVSVEKRSCSCFLQRSEFEFLVLKSAILHSCSHHFSFASAKWWHCRESKHHLSPLHVLSMQCFTVGRKSGPCRRPLLLLLPLQLLLRPAWCRAAAGAGPQSFNSPKEGPVPGKVQVHVNSPLQQLSVQN